MKRKRGLVIGFVLVSVLLALTFTACGDKSGEGDKSAPAQEAWKLPEEQGEGAQLTAFKTLNLEGEEVDQSIFANYKYTLVDVWGTYCNPCIRAMPDTEKLYQEYKDKGLGVVGIVVDSLDQSGAVSMDQVSQAQEIVKQQGATYPDLLLSDSIMRNVVSSISAVPSYFFVDSKGNITSTVYEGGRSYDEWVKIIEEETGI